MKQKQEINQSIKLSRMIPWLLMLPTLLILYFWTWRPLVMGAGMSFFKLHGFDPVEFCGFDNYLKIFQDPLLLRTVQNTLMYVFWSLVIGFLPPVILAIVVNEVVRFQGLMKFILYLPGVMPGIAVSLVWYLMYLPGDEGLLNTILLNVGIPAFEWLQNSSFTIPLIVVSMTWHGCGTTAIMYMATLQGINSELYEAAKIDGCGTLGRTWHITVPQIMPVLLLMLVRQFMGVFAIMQEPLAMTGGGPNNASLSLGLLQYQYMFQYYKPGSALSLGVLMFMLLFVLTLFYHRLDKKVSDIY